MKLKNAIIFFVCFCVLGLVYVKSHIVVQQDRKQAEIGYRLNPSPIPPRFVKILSGGFDGILADHLLLKVASFIGRNRTISIKEWKEIALVLEQCLRLDPYFEQTYIYVQGLLAWRGKMPEKAISLLDISRRHRPWDWRPGYYMAFDWYYFLKDYSRASEAFLEAAKIKGAPVLLAVLGGRFALKGGRTQAAIVLLESMLQDPEIDKHKEKEISDRITVLRGVLLLENAVKKYKIQYNAYPDSLQTLIDKGFLDKFPENPYAKQYFYEKKDGRVFFDEVGKR